MGKRFDRSACPDIRDLESRAEVLHAHLCSLARTLGVFHGFNDRLQGRNLSGPGANAVGTIMFDQLHLIATRVSAAIAVPTKATDISIGVFASALEHEKIRELVVDRASKWHGAGSEEDQRRKFTKRASQFPLRFAALEAQGGRQLKNLRNKVLAHITTEADSIDPVQLRTLWRLATRTLTLGHEISLIFRETAPDYASHTNQTKREARAIVGQIRAAQAAEERAQDARKLLRASTSPPV